MNRYLNSEGIIYEERHDNIYAYIQYVSEGLEVLRFRLMHLDFIVPITENVQADKQLIRDCRDNEPNTFLIIV